MRYFINLCLLVMVFTYSGCSKCQSGHANCGLKPDAGLCKAAIPKYYFDQKEGKCKEFIWGGCGGVVPFDTMKECKQYCEKK